MNTLIEIIAYLIEVFGSLFLGIVLLRFLLQLVRADFYNPLSQSIAKLTNPILIPLRRIIPGMFGIDVASLILAFLLHLIIAELLAMVLFHTFVNPLALVLWVILGLLQITSYIFLICMLIVVVSSFIAPFSQHPAITLARQLIEPLLKPLQKMLPPMGGLDFSVLFLGIGIFIIQKILFAFAHGTALNPKIIIGF